MKKITLFLTLIVGVSITAFGQKDKRAETILDAMSQKYKSLNTYQATFNYTSEGGGTNESFKGDLAVKGKMFRLKTAGQEVFVDGKTTATYIKESNEVNIQDYDSSEKGEFNPTKIYSMYKKGFRYKFLKEQKLAGRTVEVISLIPDKKDAQITNVQISVDKADKSVRNWQLTDKSGHKTTYQITKFTPNVALPDTYFMFDKAKYPGVEVVDLR